MSLSSTKTVADSGGGAALRSFQLTVEEGPCAGLLWSSSEPACSIGSHPSNDLKLDDDTVSRFHCEVRIDAEGARVRDQTSKNGTTVDGVRINDAWLRGDSRIRLGRSVIRFQFGTEVHHLPLSTQNRFGALVGISVAMRSAFAILDRAAATDATVLIEGETGTGKEGAAAGLHMASGRKDSPFIVIDCGAIPSNLVESELFGHERGAFTGADSVRVGAFEAAHGGTLFLDEIGELPIELQPKLLRALESRQIRRVGANAHRPVDVRVVAATHRDLRACVNDGSFRADLYYRLAVIRVTLPPLRERPEDIPALVEHITRVLTDDDELRQPLLTDEFSALLQRNAWPGNARELRNYLERCLVLGAPSAHQPPGPRTEPGEAHTLGFTVDANMPYAEARQLALDIFERAYVESLLAHHGEQVGKAAAAAGIHRGYLYRLLRRHRG